MFYRLLGKLFFLFYVCPFIRRIASYTSIELVKYVTAELNKQDKKKDKQRAQSRRDHPAGSRRPE